MARLSRLIDKERLWERIEDVILEHGGAPELSDPVIDEIYAFLSEMDTEDLANVNEDQDGEALPI